MFVITDRRILFTPATRGTPSGRPVPDGDVEVGAGLAGGEELVLDPAASLADLMLVKSPAAPAAK